jgi:hypothetical protein
MLSRLWKLNMQQMMRMALYAFGPVCYTIYATSPAQIEKSRLHLKKWYGIDCTQEAIEISEDDIHDMIKQKVEERDSKRKLKESQVN